MPIYLLINKINIIMLLVFVSKLEHKESFDTHFMLIR